MAAPARRRPCILVTDDSRDLREALVAVLGHEGYRAVPAIDGQEALRKVEREHPDLILLDYAMPGLDGPGFCRIYCERGGEAPIVLMTAALRVDIAEVRRAAEECGAAALLEKPFSVDKLLETIAHLVAPTGPPQRP
jgi:CheY-like chemotaxis protein